MTGGRTLTLALATAGGPTAPSALHSYAAESSLRACLITNTERLLKSVITDVEKMTGLQEQ